MAWVYCVKFGLFKPVLNSSSINPLDVKVCLNNIPMYGDNTKRTGGVLRWKYISTPCWAFDIVLNVEVFSFSVHPPYVGLNVTPSHHSWPGSPISVAYPYHLAFQQQLSLLTCISILPVNSCQRKACYKHPGKLQCDKPNCVFNVPAELQQISRLRWNWELFCTNSCLTLVAGTVSFECFFVMYCDMRPIIAYTVMIFDDSKVSRPLPFVGTGSY